MTQTTPDLDAELKARHRALWALGDYDAVARTVIPQLGLRVVAAAAIAPGDRVLDVAAGTGNAALPAARAGGVVTAADLTPELLDAGRAAADAEHLPVDWQVADAENLPFPDAAFDVVLSCVGVMFAPHHDLAAAELTRVCRPGGRIVLANWTPEGFVGQLFATMRPFVPAPPPGARPAPLWGREDHVASLLDGAVAGLALHRELLTVDAFAGRPDPAAAFRDLFRSAYGPVVAAYRGLAGDPDRTATLDAALVSLAAGADLGGGRMEWEYLLVEAVR